MQIHMRNVMLCLELHVGDCLVGYIAGYHSGHLKYSRQRYRYIDTYDTMCNVQEQQQQNKPKTRNIRK